ncbi:MAG: hypothetical protein EOP56_17000 [Sphingobacteriales bacterium]|nr:MAG: hypothetical protein EOP56_17000 [Sphingobacteriales bacterium]
MSLNYKSLIPYLVVAVLCIPLFSINIQSLHNWGDDFAQYIKQAQNIIEGKAYYESKYVFNPHELDYAPPQYPPGFSLLLAPFVKIWGVSFTHLEQAITICLVCLALVLCSYYRKFTNPVTAVCLALICVYAKSVLDIKNEVLSDIPCWLFVMLYFNLRKSDTFSTTRIAVIVLVALVAVFIRTQALTIIAAEGGYLFFILLKKIISQRKLALRDIYGSVGFKVSLAVLVAFVLLSQTVLRAPSSTLEFYKHLITSHNSTWWDAIGGNTYYFHILIEGMFHYYPDDTFWTVVYYFVKHIIIACVFIGLLMTAKRRFEVTHVYVIITCVLVVVLSQRQGIRLVLYLMPFFILYVHRAMHAIFPPLFSIKPVRLAVVFTLIYFLFGKFDITERFNKMPGDYMPASQDSMAFNYIRQHVSDKDIIIFLKPRVLSLYTDKRAAVLAYRVPADTNKAFIKGLGGTPYLLLNDALQDDTYKNYLNTHHALDTTVIAPGYTLYKLQ